MEYYKKYIKQINKAMFDSRVFNLPKDEVCNYFVWRQKDWTRNSIRMLGAVYYSSKQLHGVRNDKLQDMLFTEHRVNWNDLAVHLKRGTCVHVQGRKHILG